MKLQKFVRSTAYIALFTILLMQVSPLLGQGTDYTVEPYVSANFPVALAFAPDGRLFYTEKHNGFVRVISAEGTLQAEPVIQFQASGILERGLLGITLDPDYSQNGYIWIVYTSKGSDTNYPANNLVRFREENGTGYDPQVFLSVPVIVDGAIHNGGNIHFDKDGLLYLSLGDLFEPANSQNLETMPGKIHRFMVIDDELRPADGNPFPDSSIYAYGLRNPFDFTIDPISGSVFAVENGPECDDEINLILPGKNYGWDVDYQCVGKEALDVENYMPPLISYPSSVAPTGITIYDHPAMPEWNGQVFFCTFLGGVIQRAVLNEARDTILEVHDVDMQDSGCQIDITVGPDGGLYFSTPNEIYRLLPATGE